MLAIAVGLAPVAVFGAAVVWHDLTTRLEVLDLTDQSPTSKRHARSRGVIEAVVLHQTGFSRGLDPSRYLKVTAHFVVLEDGHVLQLHPLAAKLWASDSFNNRSVAVEFVGNFKSAAGKWWKPEKYGMHEPTPAQIDAGRKLLMMLRRNGIKYVYAHRQSAGDRGNDPGPEIWQGVGEWGVRRLGLSDGGPGYIEGSGAPIPSTWREPAKPT